jgi:hypothetical protein
MTTTTVVAWIGAVSGVSGLVWDFFKWKTAGPKLRLSVKTGMIRRFDGHPGLEDRAERRVVLWVRNVGTAATTVTTVGFATYESWWNRRRLRRIEGFVMDLNGLPHKLDDGAQWDSSFVQTEDFDGRLASGKLYCEVYHSCSKSPVFLHVKPKE